MASGSISGNTSMAKLGRVICVKVRHDRGKGRRFFVSSATLSVVQWRNMGSVPYRNLRYLSTGMISYFSNVFVRNTLLLIWGKCSVAMLLYV